MTLPLVCGTMGPGVVVRVSSETYPVAGFLADKHEAHCIYRNSEKSGRLAGGWCPLSLLLMGGKLRPRTSSTKSEVTH